MSRRARRAAVRAERRRRTARAVAVGGVVVVSFGGAAYLVAAQATSGSVSVDAGVPVRLLSAELDVPSGGRLELFDESGVLVGATTTTTSEPPVSSTTTTVPPTTTTTVAAEPAPLLGIGRYSYSKPLHAGADAATLAAGPAWHPESVAVGAAGRAVIAVPFNLAGVRPGDVVTVGLQRWKVVRVGVFDPVDAAVLFGDPGRPELVLYQSLPAEGAGQPFALAKIFEETQP